MQKAVALKYDYNNAPTVAAKGSGLLAEKIMEVAEENGVMPLLTKLKTINGSQSFFETLFSVS